MAASTPSMCRTRPWSFTYSLSRAKASARFMANLLECQSYGTPRAKAVAPGAAELAGPPPASVQLLDPHGGYPVSLCRDYPVFPAFPIGMAVGGPGRGRRLPAPVHRALGRGQRHGRVG